MSNYIWWWLYQLFTITLATFNRCRALLFNRLAMGVLGVLLLCNLARFIEYLWVHFGDSPTNSPVITISDDHGDSRSSFSFHTSHVFTCNFLCGYYFLYKETNQLIISFEFGLWWNPADSVSCMLLHHLRQLISSWLYVVSPSCEQFTVRSHTSV